MNIRSDKFKFSALIATALLSVGLLSGCANPLEQLAQGGIENLIKDQVKEHTGVDVELSLGDSASLPASWPAEVPTPDLPLLVSFGSADQGWQATFQAQGKSQWEALVQQLENAGYQKSDVIDMDAVVGTILSGDTYDVSVNYLGRDGDATISMLVFVQE